MTKNQYNKRMIELQDQYQRVWNKIVEATNDYIETNDHTSMTGMMVNGENKVENFADYMMKSGAWIYDRLDGKKGTPGLDGYKGSMTKKIRKVLGYVW